VIWENTVPTPAIMSDLSAYKYNYCKGNNSLIADVGMQQPTPAIMNNFFAF
jgi:hypothetical protein